MKRLVTRTLYDSVAAQTQLVPLGAVPIGVQGVPHFTTSGSRVDLSLGGTHTTLVPVYDSVYTNIVVLFEADTDLVGRPVDKMDNRTFYVVREGGDIPENCNLIGTFAAVNGGVMAVYMQEHLLPCMWCGREFRESYVHEHEAEQRCRWQQCQ